MDIRYRNYNNMNTQATCPDYLRLDRIEDKIDRISDLIIAIARTEEKVNNLAENNRQHDDSIDEIEDRIVVLEKLVGLNTRTVNSVHKLVWVITTAIITGFLAYIVAWPPV